MEFSYTATIVIPPAVSRRWFFSKRLKILFGTKKYVNFSKGKRWILGYDYFYQFFTSARPKKKKTVVGVHKRIGINRPRSSIFERFTSRAVIWERILRRLKMTKVICGAKFDRILFKTVLSPQNVILWFFPTSIFRSLRIFLYFKLKFICYILGDVIVCVLCESPVNLSPDYVLIIIFHWKHQ